MIHILCYINFREIEINHKCTYKCSYIRGFYIKYNIFSFIHFLVFWSSNINFYFYCIQFNWCFYFICYLYKIKVFVSWHSSGPYFCQRSQRRERHEKYVSSDAFKQFQKRSRVQMWVLRSPVFGRKRDII